MVEVRYFKATYEEDARVFKTRLQRYPFYLLLAAVAAYPFIVDRYFIYMMNLTFIAIVATVGLNILMGYAGQISLGQAAFLAIGAYTSAYLVEIGVPFYASVIAAGLFTGLVGLIAGLPALRLKGLYLAVATLALHFVVWQLIIRLEPITGGGMGRTVDSVFRGDREWYFFLLGLTAFAVFAGVNVARTKFGRGFGAVRDRDVAAEMIGVSLSSYKIQAFVLSSLLVGLAGAAYGHYVSFIGPESFGLDVAIQYLGMVLVGGQASIVGSILGATLFTWLPEGLRFVTNVLAASVPQLTSRFSEVRSVAYGLVIIAFLLIEPAGLAGIWENTKKFWRNWPFTY